MAGSWNNFKPTPKILKIGDKVTTTKISSGLNKILTIIDIKIELKDPDSKEYITWVAIKEIDCGYFNIDQFDLIIEKNVCTCDIMLLMRAGCHCGSIQKERELKYAR